MRSLVRVQDGPPAQVAKTKKRSSESAPYLTYIVRENAGSEFRVQRNLENCIELGEKAKKEDRKVKLIRANGGYLGTRKRRRT